MSNNFSLTFSGGWLINFKTRYGISYTRVHGEAMSADIAAIARDWPHVGLLNAKYVKEDVCNASEFGLFSGNNMARNYGIIN